MKPSLLFYATFALSACTFDGSNQVTRDGGTIDADPSAPDAAPPLLVPGFSSDYEEFLVPSAGTTEGFYKSEISDGSKHWRLLNIDEDGWLELVQTADPDSNPAALVWKTGEDHYWKVFEAGTTRFPDLPLKLPVPSVTTRGFYSFHESTWIATDINGDNNLDIVRLTEGGNLFGSGAWSVLLGTGSGFEAETLWNVPDLDSGQPKTLENCNATNGCWRVFDIDRDGAPDLIHTTTSSNGSVFDADTTPNWHVYKGIAGRFDDESSWTLPYNGHSAGFLRLDRPFYWATFDIDGDGAPELIQTQAVPGAVPPGEVFTNATGPFWKVFKPQGNGFSSSWQPWAVPNEGTSFDAITRVQNSSYWDILDIDGDKKIDLVHTADPSMPGMVWGATSSPHWKVYLGTEDGFSSTATTWPVPNAETPMGFYTLSISEDNVNEHWLTVDIDGDGQVELIQTANPMDGNVWKNTEDKPYWRVYRRATN